MNPPAFGDKDRCPQCLSHDVRAMRTDEMEEFYGSDQFVLTMPRFCKACRHDWEVRSVGGGMLMIVLSGLGILVGLGLIAGGVGYLIIKAHQNGVISLRVLLGCFVGGLVITVACCFALVRYWRHVSYRPPDEEAREEGFW